MPNQLVLNGYHGARSQYGTSGLDMPIVGFGPRFLVNGSEYSNPATELQYNLLENMMGRYLLNAPAFGLSILDGSCSLSNPPRIPTCLHGARA